MSPTVETIVHPWGAVLTSASLEVARIVLTDGSWRWSTAAGDSGASESLDLARAQCEASYWRGEVARRDIAIEAMERAAFTVAPYLRYTIGPDSPSHHPTMPSAVAVFESVFTPERSRERMNARIKTGMAA